MFPRALSPLLEESEYGSLSYVVHFLTTVEQLQLRAVSRFFQKVACVSLSLRKPSLNELCTIMFRLNKKMTKVQPRRRDPTLSQRSAAIFLRALYRTQFQSEFRLLLQSGLLAADSMNRFAVPSVSRDESESVPVESLKFLKSSASLVLYRVEYERREENRAQARYAISSAGLAEHVQLLLPQGFSNSKIPLLVWMWSERTHFIGRRGLRDDLKARIGVVSDFKETESSCHVKVQFHVSPWSLVLSASSRMNFAGLFRPFDSSNQTSLKKEAIQELFNKAGDLEPLFLGHTWLRWMLRFDDSFELLANLCDVLPSVVQELSVLNQPCVFESKTYEEIMLYMARKGVSIRNLVKNLPTTPQMVLKLLKFCLRWNHEVLGIGVLHSLCSQWSPLFEPILRPLIEICNFDVNALSEDGRPPLMALMSRRISRRSRLETQKGTAHLDTLLEFGADVNFVSGKGTSILGLTLQHSSFAGSLWLLQNGAKIAADCLSSLIASLPSIFGSSLGLKVLELLLDFGIDRRMLIAGSSHCIFKAISLDCSEGVKLLLSGDGSEDLINTALGGEERRHRVRGNTPLLQACFPLQVKTVLVLLNDERSNLLAKNAKGETALHLLAKNRHSEKFIRDLLIAFSQRQPTLLNLLDSSSRSPVDVAVKSTNLQFALDLMTAGSLPTSRVFELNKVDATIPDFLYRTPVRYSRDEDLDWSIGQRVLLAIHSKLEPLPVESLFLSAQFVRSVHQDPKAVRVLVEVGLDARRFLPSLLQFLRERGSSSCNLNSGLPSFKILDFLIDRVEGGIDFVCDHCDASPILCVYLCHKHDFETLQGLLQQSPECFPQKFRMLVFRSALEKANTRLLSGLLASGLVSILNKLSRKTLLSIVVDRQRNRKRCDLLSVVMGALPDATIVLPYVVSVLEKCFVDGLWIDLSRLSALCVLLKDCDLPSDVVSPSQNRIIQRAMPFLTLSGICLGLLPRAEANTSRFVQFFSRKLVLKCRLGHDREARKFSLLHFFCYKGYTKAVEILLRGGAPVNIKSSGGRLHSNCLTPVQLAAHGSHWNLVAWLIRSWNAQVSFSFRKKYGSQYLRISVV